MNNMPSDFDRWLTTDPRDADEEAFERFCDEHDVDPDSSRAQEEFEAWKDEIWD